MFTSVQLNPDTALSDGTNRLPRVNKLLGDYANALVNYAGATIVSDNDPPTSPDNVIRTIILSFSFSNHYLQLNTGGNVSYNRKYIYGSMLKLNGVDKLHSNTIYLYSSGDSGCMPTRAYITNISSLFCTFTATCQTTYNRIAYIKLTDDSYASIATNSNIITCYLDDSDTAYNIVNNEDSYNYITEEGKEILIPSRIRSAANQILVNKPADNLWRFGNVGGYGEGNVIKDNNNKYYLVLKNKYLLGGV
jgi:hypothetical protein